MIAISSRLLTCECWTTGKGKKKPTTSLPDPDEPSPDINALHYFQERSSSKRKEIFRKVQIDLSVPSAQTDSAVHDPLAAELPVKILSLLLDMPVRWSSTFGMSMRAYKLRDV